MQKIFFISDHHFYHTNIIKYCDRPFSDMLEMNDFMIKMWNSVVNDDDIVIHGGDFMLGSSRKYREKASFLLSSLKGRKIIVKGNHDRSRNTLVSVGFSHACLYYYDNNILVVHNLDKAKRVIPDLIDAAHIVLYGHIHNNLEYDDPKYKFINICVELLHYTPRTIDELKELNYERITRGEQTSYLRPQRRTG